MRRFTRILEGLPPTIPFVPPEALERRSGRRIRLRLGANESGFGISPQAREAMRRAIDEAAWYGDPESHVLREHVAAMHGTGVAHIVVGAGIDELLGMAVRAFVEPGEGVALSYGSYPTFGYHVKAHGGVLHTVPYLGDRNDLEGLAAAAGAGESAARLVYLSNPDNPTGSFHPPDAIRALVEGLPDGCVLILDEAYGDFVPRGDLPAIDAGDPRVIRMRTFSKAHGLAGARIGYAVAAPDVIASFDKFRLHFGVNRIAQDGALASLRDTAFLASVVAGVEQGRRDYEALGAALGLPALPSLTNFVAFDAGDGARARAIHSLLLDEDVFVRMGAAPPLDRLLRITVGTPEQRAGLAETLHLLRTRGVLCV